MTRPKIEFKCPHCGWIYDTAEYLDSGNLVPNHPCEAGTADPGILHCPGSGQVPRGLADRRPLWKDEKKTGDEPMPRVFMICQTPEVQKDASEMFKRVAAALSAVNTYFDKACATDDDATELELARELAPALERLTLTLMDLYPNPRQFETDIKSIGDFTVRTIPAKGN